MKTTLAILLLFVSASIADAQGCSSRRTKSRTSTRSSTSAREKSGGRLSIRANARVQSSATAGGCIGGNCGMQLAVVVKSGTALDEVNALRSARGLPPFILDDNLTVAAQGAATFRARMRISGHTTNDFSFLPAGASANSAGCAAWPSSMGWGSCCIYDRATYAGAAFAVGPDGLRYMHLFVR